MNVDVGQVGRHVEPQKANRIAACKQQAAIGFAQGVLQRPIANVAAVEKQVLQAIIRPTVLWVGCVPLERDRRIDTLDLNQSIG